MILLQTHSFYNKDIQLYKCSKSKQYNTAYKGSYTWFEEIFDMDQY